MCILVVLLWGRHSPGDSSHFWGGPPLRPCDNILWEVGQIFQECWKNEEGNQLQTSVLQLLVFVFVIYFFFKSPSFGNRVRRLQFSWEACLTAQHAQVYIKHNNVFKKKTIWGMGTSFILTSSEVEESRSYFSVSSHICWHSKTPSWEIPIFLQRILL